MTALACSCGSLTPLTADESAILADWGATPLCATCNAQDATQVIRDREEAERAEAVARRAAIPDLLVKHGAPRRLVEDVRRMQTRDHQARACALAAAWGRGDYGVESTLTLFGPNRTGKSLLACLGLGTAAAAGQPVAWVRASRLAGAAQSDDARERHTVDRLLAADGRRALVIDDIDKTRATSYGAALMFDLVDGWHSNGWPLLVTGNNGFDGPDGLAAQYPQHGEAIVGRLEEGTVETVGRPEENGR